MKTNLLKFSTVALILSVSFSSCSCGKKDDMSGIDFSNIENLYEQPLPVIQKCMQGKWKWYVSFGGHSGADYSDNTFVDIRHDHYIIEYENGQQRTVFYKWKRREICFPYSEHHLHKGKKTYFMWNKSTNNETFSNGWFFGSIKNDTLIVHVDTYPDVIYDFPYELRFVRIDNLENNNR